MREQGTQAAEKAKRKWWKPTGPAKIAIAVILTLLSAFASGPWLHGAIRFLIGWASGWAMVLVAAWSNEQLHRHGRAGLSAAVFAGPGCGIFVSGLLTRDVLQAAQQLEALAESAHERDPVHHEKHIEAHLEHDMNEVLQLVAADELGRQIPCRLDDRQDDEQAQAIA